MGKKADNLVERWRRQCPPMVKLSDVQKVLKTYGFTQRIKRTGHDVYEHPALATRPDLFSHDPHIHIPTVKGRSVKKYYIKHLIQAIDVVREWKKGQDTEEDEGMEQDDGTGNHPS